MARATTLTAILALIAALISSGADQYLGFLIDRDKTRTIHAAMFFPPPEAQVPNWPPYDGNWPIGNSAPQTPPPAR
jgi:hypothetical protein